MTEQAKPREFSASVRRLEYVGRRYVVIEAQCSSDFIHTPGQFTKVSFQDEAGRFERYYSIASAPQGNGYFELCLILDDPRLRALVESWVAGSEFLCSAPAGRFTVPPATQPVVCVAGGSGITPLKAICEDRVLNYAGAETALLYGCQNDADIPFYERLQALRRQTTSFDLHFYADENLIGRAESGRPIDHLPQFINKRAEYLLCGPPPFMEAAKRVLLDNGIAPEAIHQDRY